MWPFTRSKPPPAPPRQEPPAPAETELARLQRQVFERIIEGKAGPQGIDDWRLQVYSGMYEARAHDALAEDVPHAAKLLGAAFLPLVKRYVADVAPTHHSLARLGHGFAQWLRAHGAPVIAQAAVAAAGDPAASPSAPGATGATSPEERARSAPFAAAVGSASTPPVSTAASLTASASVAAAGDAAAGDAATAAEEASASASSSPGSAAVAPGRAVSPDTKEAAAPERAAATAGSAEHGGAAEASSGATDPAAGHEGHAHAAPLSLEHASRPDLADLAELEWARSEAFVADDCTPVEAAEIQQLGPERFTRSWVQLVPSFRLLELEHDVLPLWKATEAQQHELPPATAARTHVIVWRKGFEVFHVAVEADEYAALKAAQARTPIGAVCEHFAARGDDAAHAAFQAIGSWFNEGMIGALREPPQAGPGPP